MFDLLAVAPAWAPNLANRAAVMNPAQRRRRRNCQSNF
jgi:hypothetical protein